MSSNGSYRIGVDTGGTFTDVVAVRAGDGAVFSAKVASTPEEPERALYSAIRVILEQTGASPSDVSALVHGTTVATNAMLGRRGHNLGLVVNQGFRHILEIARQNVPGGFAHSYFWVKPPRLVPVDRVFEVEARMDFRGNELTPLEEESARDMAYRYKKLNVGAVGVCLLHSYANPAHELRLREIFAEEHPECHVSLSCEVLPEYQEYERAVTTLLDAACKPVMKSYVDRAVERVAEELSEATPFFIMKSNGGVVSAHRAAERPLTTAASGPAAGVHACAALAEQAGLEKIITLDAGGTSTDVSVVESGRPVIAAHSSLGGYSISVPMVDVVTAGTGSGSIAWIDKGGKLRAGPRSAGADPGPMSYGKGGEEPTVTDAMVCLGLLPGQLAGEEIGLDRARAEEGIGRIAEAQGIPLVEAAKGILEIATWDQALAIREMTVRRGKDPREYSLVAFGGAGPLMAADIAGILGVREVIVPPHPGCLSARGLIDAGLRSDYVKTHIAPLEESSYGELKAQFESMMQDAAAELEAEHIHRPGHHFSLAVDLRYRGEGQEVTVMLPEEIDIADGLATAKDQFHEASRQRFGFSREGLETTEVVNLRLTAEAGPDHAQRQPEKVGEGAEGALIGERDVYFDGIDFIPAPVYDRGRLGGGDLIEGPAIVEDHGSTTPVPPGCRLEVDKWGNLRVEMPARGKSADSPVLREILEGAINAAEREMADIVADRALSPMIREMRSYGAGLFDREGRQLTGRSFSAEVWPVLKNWPQDEIREGDVFIWNDAYESAGTGRLSDLCLCIPVFHAGELIAFPVVFGHHDDIGGAVAGSLPVDATDIFQEGGLIPPVKLYEEGKLNEMAGRIIFRNSRFPEHLRADIDAGVSACRTGGARIGELCERFGQEAVLDAFSAFLEGSALALRNELLPKIPVGEYQWEDFIESDGVTRKKMHTLKLKMTKTNEKITLDFRGTSPQAAGPINWPGDRAGGRFLKKWLASALRNLADNYDRMFEIDINEGVCDLIDIVFPEPGSLITPRFPAATNMGAFTLQRMLNLFTGTLGMATKGRLPADQETLRFWGVKGLEPEGKFFFFREILGGGSGGRSWADGEDAVHMMPGSMDLPVEITENRFPLRVERAGLIPDSGGPGKRRGGLGFFKEIRVLCDCEVISQGDRTVVGPWGVNGGRAGGSYSVTINPGTPALRNIPSLSNGTKVIEGDLVRVETTGGGGWGNPFDREFQYVRRDVLWGKVTFDGAMRHYGVVFSDEKNFKVDADGSMALRRMMSSKRKNPPFFHRGANFSTLKSQGVFQ